MQFKDQRAPGASQDPHGEDGELIAGHEQFDLYRGDFLADVSDDDGGETGDPHSHADHSGDPAGDGEGGEQQAAPPEDGGTTGDDDPPPAKPFRHKTHEEAERSYANLMSRTTRAEQDNARLRKQLEEIEAAKEKARRDEQIRTQKDEFIANKYEEANRAVENLDPDDPEYHSQTAKIWAGVHRAIETFEPTIEEDQPRRGGAEGLPRASEYIQDNNRGEPTGPEGVSPPDGPDAAPSDTEGESVGEQLTVEQIYQKIDTVLSEKKPGFDREDPAFISFCSRAPDKDASGRLLSLDEQIDYAVQATKAHYDKIRRDLLQTSAQPMNKGAAAPFAGAGHQGQQQESTETFGDIVDAAVQSHTL